MSLFLQVNFVSRDDKADIISQHFPELFDPVFDFGETVCIRDVIDKYSSIGISAQGIFNEIYPMFLELTLIATTDCYWIYIFKGQLISKGNLSVFQKNERNFCPSLLGQKFFVRFFGELKKQRSPFEKSWFVKIKDKFEKRWLFLKASF